MSGKADDHEIPRFLDAWFAVRQVIQAANFNHFQKAGLSATQFMILNLLPETGERITMGELARRLNLKPATVAKTVDSLESRKMLSRHRSEDDGRLVLLQITGKGKKLQNAAVGQFRAQIGTIFRAIPAADRKSLILGLESLVRAAEGHPVQGAPPRIPNADAARPAKRSSRQSPPG